MKIIVFGIGDLAKQLSAYLNLSEEFSLEYFCVNKQYKTSDVFLEKPVITLEDDLINFSKEKYQIILAIGYSNMRLRKKVYHTISDLGFHFINYIHPSVVNHGEIMGEGNIILANVTIEPFANIGSNNIIWSNTVICHDVEIGNHNFIAANSVIGGFSKVDENNFIGFNSTIKDNIHLEKKIIIGANSLVTKNPDNYSLNYGTPAQLKSYHEKNGIHIT